MAVPISQASQEVRRASPFARIVTVVGLAVALVGLGMFVWVVARGLFGGLDGSISANDDLMPWLPIAMVGMLGGLAIAVVGLALASREG